MGEIRKRQDRRWQRPSRRVRETVPRQSSVTCRAVLVVVSGIPIMCFSVLSRGRSSLHLAVLEALYIRKLDPELCVQKENVLSLQLFGTVSREEGK